MYGSFPALDSLQVSNSANANPFFDGIKENTFSTGDIIASEGSKDNSLKIVLIFGIIAAALWAFLK